MGCSSSVATARLSIHEQYTFSEKLGEGAFGQVRACVNNSTQLDCAVKIVDTDGRSSRQKATQKEAFFWKRAGENPHIVNLLETYTDDSFSYFVMERCERSLYDLLLDMDVLKEAQLLQTFRQMLLGLEHCHSVAIVHRDVKPANFLVSDQGVVKLCDFGLAHLEKEKGITGLAGTAPFMSPEMVLGQIYDRKTDIWSLGASCYLMLYGRYPYQVKDQQNLAWKDFSASKRMQKAIGSNAPPPSYEALYCASKPSVQQARNFVQTLLTRQAITRPSASEALKLRSMQLDVPVQDAATRSQEVSLSPTIRLAKQMTAELKTPVDPTVAKTMDALIEQLQKQFRRPLVLRSISLPDSCEKSLGLCSTASTRRSISHGGEFSMGLCRQGDEASECSTAASASTSLSMKFKL